MQQLLSIVFSTDFLFSMIRISTPLIFAALAALISRKAGIINLAIESSMLSGALAAVVFSALTQNAVMGVVFAIVVGVIMTLILGFFTIYMQTNLRLACVALNLLDSGGTVLVLFLLTGNKGVSTTLESMVIPNINIPIIESIPILGAVVSGHNALTYFAFLCVWFIHILLYRTKLGLRIRSVGENEDLAASVGLSVKKIKLTALLISGAFGAIGGAYLSMGYVSWFAREMSAGRGVIGVAAMYLGNATPVGAMLAAMLFGFAEAVGNQLQALSIPVEFIQMTPYIFSIVGLVLFSIARDRKENKIVNERKK